MEYLACLIFCVGSLDKLMESSLSNLNDPSPTSARRHTFNKFTHPAGTISTSQNKPTAAKSFAESSKARSWTVDTASLDGVFAQHVQVPLYHGLPQEDNFGEFQSGPNEDSGRSLGMSGHVGRAPGQSERVPGQAGGVPGQLDFISGQGVPPGQGSNHSSTSGQQQFLSHNVPQGHGMRVTTANQHPIPTTSISGWTKEGYISSDVVQSRSYAGPSGVAPASTNRRPENSMPAANFAGLDATKFPAVYMEVYRRCGQPGGGPVNTELAFPLLLSSQLPRSMLRELWSLANRGVPGQLSQTELFVLLGLIALVQVLLSKIPLRLPSSYPLVLLLLLLLP